MDQLPVETHSQDSEEGLDMVTALEIQLKEGKITQEEFDQKMAQGHVLVQEEAFECDGCTEPVQGEKIALCEDCNFTYGLCLGCFEKEDQDPKHPHKLTEEDNLWTAEMDLDLHEEVEPSYFVAKTIAALLKIAKNRFTTSLKVSLAKDKQGFQVELENKALGRTTISEALEDKDMMTKFLAAVSPYEHFQITKAPDCAFLDTDWQNGQ